MFDELCWRLVGDGVPLFRATLHMGTLHPQIGGVGVRWLGALKIVEEYRILLGSEATDEYLRSPIRASIERGTPFRRRLTEDSPEYPLLSKLKDFGVTDYFALALNRTIRRFPVVTWATDRPSGFSNAEIAAPVGARKGETLKFMGDGVLAIFPAADDDDFSGASVQALEAALEGLERLGQINKTRRENDQPEVRIGIGLHLGEVIFGNVGAADRPDFTVIGPAVNLASRIEGLTKRLLRPILVSSAFARICPRPLVSLGFHPVRGLFEPEEVFGLPE